MERCGVLSCGPLLNTDRMCVKLYAGDKPCRQVVTREAYVLGNAYPSRHQSLVWMFNAQNGIMPWRSGTSASVPMTRLTLPRACRAMSDRDCTQPRFAIQDCPELVVWHHQPKVSLKKLTVLQNVA
jgi:hypothetical protein